MHPLRPLFLVGAFLACCTSAWADDNPRPGDAALVGQYGFEPQDVGFLAVDAETGQTVSAYHPGDAFMPASAVKIVALAAALAEFGPDYRFETQVFADRAEPGAPGVSTLYLKGGGDPFLSGDDLVRLVARVKEAGVTGATDSFVYDASLLNGRARLNDAQPDGVGYNPGISALSANFNRVRLSWTRGDDQKVDGRVGAVSKSVDVPLEGFSVAMDDTNRSDHPKFLRASDPSEEDWILASTLPKNGSAWLPVGDPPAMAAQLFRALAAEEGIELPKPEVGIVPPNAELIATLESPSLAAIAKGVLRYSNNMSAELVGMAFSREQSGQPVSLEQSVAVTTDWLEDTIPQTDWSGMVLDNHSGLSTATKITPRQLVDILRYSETLPDERQIGDQLQNRTWKAIADKGAKVHAKTGTMDFVRGLAGYLTTRSGRTIAFAIFSNDAEKRAISDASIEARSDARQPGRQGWLKRARALEKALIANWTNFRPQALPNPRPHYVAECDAQVDCG